VDPHPELLADAPAQERPIEPREGLDDHPDGNEADN